MTKQKPKSSTLPKRAKPAPKPKHDHDHDHAREPELNPEVAQVRDLAQVLSQFGLAELEFENAGVRVHLRRGPTEPQARVMHTPILPMHTHATPAALSASMMTHATEPVPEQAVPTAPVAAGSFITSPFVGTFYRSPSPDLAPFVEVGQRIKKGQVLCIVEAMKLMNEIESERDGTIVEVLAQNGQPVEYGERLFRLDS
jgi:acetyl-CoA carboxylase biotin carboxyl carrier protein